MVVSAIWVALALIVGISFATHKHKTYYGDTQYCTYTHGIISSTFELNGCISGCWITSDYPVQRIVLEYLWMWITAFLNFILYIPIALVIMFDATVAMNGWHIRFVKNPMSLREDGRAEKRLAVKMLVYVFSCIFLRNINY